MLSCEFCEISKNIFFTEQFWKTASLKSKFVELGCAQSDNSRLIKIGIQYRGAMEDSHFTVRRMDGRKVDKGKRRGEYNFFLIEIFSKIHQGKCFSSLT